MGTRSDTTRRRRRIAQLVLAALLGTGIAVAVVSPEAGSTRLAREQGAPTSGLTQRDEQVQESSRGRSCPDGTAAVRERAVVGRGTGKLCITVGRNLTGSTHVDPFFSDVSSLVIGFYRDRVGDRGGTGSTVVCWSRADWLEIGGKGLLGFVWPGTRVVNLAPEVCARLDRIVYDGGRGETYDTAEAVDTLAHESLHVAGTRDEARTECYAMQLTQYTGERLGGTARFGYELGAILFDDYESWRGTDYYTPKCDDGSELDLYPETTVFP